MTEPEALGGDSPAGCARELRAQALPERPVLAQHAQRAGLRRTEGAQHDARLDRAVPAVALEPQRDVARRVGGERLLSGAEGDSAGAHPRAQEREARVLALLPHAGHVRDARRRHEQRRLRVAHPEWPQQVELLGQLEAELAAGHHGVDALDGDQVVRSERRTGVARERLAERLEEGRLELDTGRHPMAAEAGEMARAGGEPAVEVVCGDAAPRPAPGAAVLVQCDHHGGPAPPLDEPRRDDAHDPRVPAAVRHDQCGPARLRRAGGVGRKQDARLRLLAVAVEEVELAGDLVGARARLGEEQLERGVRAAHAAGGVDAWAKPEAERMLGQLCRLDRGHRHQRAQPRLLAARQRAQPLPDDPPVLVAQRDEVADRRERGEVQVVVGRARLVTGSVTERVRELQNDAGGAQRGGIGRAAWRRRMHERAVRQLCARPVVVRDDHVESGGARGGDLLDGRDAAVHRHEQADAACGEPLDGGARKPVAIVEAARQHPGRLRAERAQGPHEHRRRADAVDVVVPEHGYTRAAPDMLEDQLAGLRHARQGARVMALLSRDEAAGLFEVGKAAARQHGPNRRRHAEPLREPARQRNLVGHALPA